MIIEIQQYRIGDNSSYKCTRDGRDICDVWRARQLDKDEYFLRFLKTGKDLKLYFSRMNNPYAKGKGFLARFAVYIIENGESVGSILMDPHLYGAYDVEYRGRKFRSYVLDAIEGQCLCVENEAGTLIAEIGRHPKPYYHRDYYVGFAEDTGCESEELLQELICLLAIHIDLMVYDQIGQEETSANMEQPGCKEAYQHFSKEFIERIAADESFNLNREPMNPYADGNKMPDVEIQKSPEAEHTGVKTHKVVHGIFIAFLIVFLYFFINQLLLFL